jgi:NAD(P)-dependent dehydrogenase (short-subunit alcohol dehydrogenase family)
VTGAAKRIGREIALGFAAQGAGCLVHYHRSVGPAQSVVAECQALGVRAEALAADLESPSDICSLAEEATKRGVDILVHNASTFSRLPFLESDAAAHAETLDRDWAVHVRAPYLLGRLLGEHMVAKGFGRIVLFGDWSSEAAVYRHYAPYIVSKAAVPALAKTLALELGSRSAGVTVNAILPGPIVPPEGHDPATVEMVARQTVLGSWVGASDVVRAVLFLVGSDKVTGTVVRVDGGRAIKAL